MIETLKNADAVIGCVLGIFLIFGLLWVLLPLIIHAPTDKGGK